MGHNREIVCSFFLVDKVSISVGAYYFSYLITDAMILIDNRYFVCRLHL